MSNYLIGPDAAISSIKAGKNTFITGPGGSGKSHIIHQIKETMGEDSLFLAPTGIAALNIDGMTAHKAMGLAMGISTHHDFTKVRSDKQAKLLSSKAIKRIVLDEISMFRADKLMEMDYKLRHFRKNSQPFGGLQVIAFGDGFQISPVLKREETAEFYSLFKSEIPFDSETWDLLGFTCVLLDKVWRQEDAEFAAVLNKLRMGIDISQGVQYMNSRCGNKGTLEDAVTLTTTNKLAEEINKRMFDSLPGRKTTHRASLTGDFKERPVSDVLEIKEGLKVMITANDTETPARYVNGTVGIVRRCAASYVLVDIDGDLVEVMPKEWKNINYEIVKEPKPVLDEHGKPVMDENGKPKMRMTEVKAEKVLGKFSQFPIKMGYAITIHKSQGLTLGRVNIDLGFGAFAPGQAYVALSRAKSTEGLRLVKPLRNKDILVDKRVVDFYLRTFPILKPGA